MNTTTEQMDIDARMFAIWCVNRVQHHATDDHSWHAFTVARNYILGKATKEDLKKAYEEATKANANRNWLRYTSDAARYSAHPDPLKAAYLTSKNICLAVADSVAERLTQPEKWEQAKEKELKAHKNMLNKFASLKGKLKLSA